MCFVCLFFIVVCSLLFFVVVFFFFFFFCLFLLLLKFLILVLFSLCACACVCVLEFILAIKALGKTVTDIVFYLCHFFFQRKLDLAFQVTRHMKCQPLLSLKITKKENQSVVCCTNDKFKR